MIRPLRVTDIARQLAPGRLNGEDLARPRESLLSGPQSSSLMELIKLNLTSPSRAQGIGIFRGLQMKAVVVVRPRHGSRSWEIAHLVIEPKEFGQVGKLLEQCAAYVGSQGGERLFLRVQDESPLRDEAFRVGFMSAALEQVYQPAAALQVGEDQPPYLPVRKLEAADLHGLFRLYNACYPASLRSAYGLTLDQWIDSQETPHGKTDEYVWEQDSRLIAWIRLSESRTATTIDAMLHGDAWASAWQLYAQALKLAKNQRLAWVVLAHQEPLARALEQAGWLCSQQYKMMIKPVAKPVQEISLAPVQA